MKPAQVLVVDQDVDGARWLRELAADLGYAVAVARDAEDALLVATRTSFDLVLADVGIGRPEWFELIAKLRERAPAPAIVAITAFGSMGLGARALAAGASAYLRKPFTADELGERMRQVLERRAIRLRNERLRDEVDRLRRGPNDPGRKT
jgi:DNA-binding response OmpR family regulator